MEESRRKLLKTGGTLLSVGLAGCTGNNDDTSATSSPTPNTTEPTENSAEEDSTRTPENNNETGTEQEPDIPDSYRVDRKRKTNADAEVEDVGNHSTEHEWDDLVTNTEEINQMQQEWIEEEAYTPLVNQVMSGEDFESGGRIFPNYNFEGEENDIGFFDQDAVQEEDDFETLVRWYLPAIMEHDRENYGNAPSSRNNRFAATLETLINQHHSSAEAQTTFVKAFPAHGIFGVQDKNNEEFYLVDTTPASPQGDSAVAKIGEDFVTSENGNRSELWDPFHSFEPGAPSYGTYEGKSEYSMGALMALAATNNMGENFDQLFITDEWMDKAYNVLREGGSIDPIVEPIEEVLYNAPQLEDNQKIGIYGNLDDTRIAVTTGDEIYDQVMYDKTKTPGIEEIESMLEVA